VAVASGVAVGGTLVGTGVNVGLAVLVGSIWGSTVGSVPVQATNTSIARHRIQNALFIPILFSMLI